MNSAEEILQKLQKTGLKLEVIDGGMIKAQPKTLLTDETRQLIQEYKPQLIQLLSEKEKGKEKKLTWATGYGCGCCGYYLYYQIIAWKTRPLPNDLRWEYEHLRTVAWKCGSCGQVYHMIGGLVGPQVMQ